MVRYGIIGISSDIAITHPLYVQLYDILINHQKEIHDIINKYRRYHSRKDCSADIMYIAIMLQACQLNYTMLLSYICHINSRVISNWFMCDEYLIVLEVNKDKCDIIMTAMVNAICSSRNNVVMKKIYQLTFSSGYISYGFEGIRLSRFLYDELIKCCQNDVLDLVIYLCTNIQNMDQARCAPLNCFKKSCEYGRLDIILWIINMWPETDMFHDNDSAFKMSCLNDHQHVSLWLCSMCSRYAMKERIVYDPMICDVPYELKK